jgi:hypothetical protein
MATTQEQVNRAVRELDHALYLLGSEVSPVVDSVRKAQEILREGR